MLVKYIYKMVSKSKKANAKAFRRSRNKRSKMNKRTTRRRKGGECGDIRTYGDNHHCVEAGCDPFICAKYYKASKPHKPIVDDETHKLAAEMENLRLRRLSARNDRQTRRRTASQSRASTSTSSKSSPLTEEQKEKRLQQFNAHLAGIPSSDSEDE
jgi:hypothetical protein